MKICVHSFFVSMVLLLVLNNLFLLVLNKLFFYLGGCLINDTWLLAVSIQRAFIFFSAVAWWYCWCCFVIDDFLVVFFDDHGQILCAAVADFDGISIKYFVELARSREVLVN